MRNILVVAALSFLLVLPASAAEFNVNLKYGSRGTEVKKLQEFLTDYGFYSGPITGNFYSLTLKSLKRFQTAHGLPSTGFFGGMTRAEANVMLENELKDQESEPDFASTTVSNPSTTSDVVQKISEQTAKVEEQSRLIAEQNRLLQEQNDLMRQNVGAVPTETSPAPLITPAVPVPPAPKQWNWNYHSLSKSNDGTNVQFNFWRSPANTTISVTMNSTTVSTLGDGESKYLTIDGLTPNTHYYYNVVLTGEYTGTYRAELWSGN